MNPSLKVPSVWMPTTLSLAVIALIIINFLFFGVPAPQSDEGTLAHIFQIWLVLEFFLLSYFSIKWLPQKPVPSLYILIFQIFLIFIGCFPVFYFHL